MNRSDDNFLLRWSKRKRGTNDGEPAVEREGAAPAPAPLPATPDAVASEAVSPPPAAPDAPDAPDANEAGAAAEALERVDIDALDFSSDYTRFMEQGVSDDLRNKALSKLWASDPIFGFIDGLDDYCEDFSDAVWATGEIKTAYRVGRGFLTDEEVAAWDNLDKQPETVVAEAAPEAAPEVDPEVDPELELEAAAEPETEPESGSQSATHADPETEPDHQGPATMAPASSIDPTEPAPDQAATKDA